MGWSYSANLVIGFEFKDYIKLKDFLESKDHSSLEYIEDYLEKYPDAQLRSAFTEGLYESDYSVATDREFNSKKVLGIKLTTSNPKDFYKEARESYHILDDDFPNKDVKVHKFVSMY